MDRTTSTVLPTAYRSIQAHIILKCSTGDPDAGDLPLPKSIMIISVRGSFPLDVTDPIPDAYLQHARSTSDGDDTTTGSSANLALASLWLQNCLRDHPLCSKVIAHQKTGFHPRRLINLEDPAKPFLQVMSGSSVPYIALSYAWGDGYRFLTERHNYDQHQICLPLDKLPRTFKDAMCVVSALGYTHIWIDALCIIQNVPADLEAELPIMGDIYRHAVFTIYAEGSSSSQAGLFHARNPAANQPCTVTVTGIGTVDPATLTLATKVTGPDYLKARSWCLQEEVLTCRFLSFGSKQISWRCISATASETHPAPRPRSNAVADVLARDAIDRLRMWLYAPVEMMSATPRQGGLRRDNHFDAWYAVVEEYSGRQLRAVSDNIPALSGLAAVFARCHGVSYRAGLWAEDVQQGLAWYVALGDCRKVVCMEGPPSWSWAAVGKVRVRFRSWEVHSADVAGEGVEVVEMQDDTARLVNPWGAVRLGPLRLRGRVWKGVLKPSEEYARYRTRPVLRPGDNPFTGFEGEDKKEHPRFPAVIADGDTGVLVAEVALDADMAGGPGVEVCCLLLHVQTSHGTRRYTFLVLVESSSDGTDVTAYRRIGLGWASEGSSRVVKFSGEDVKTEVQVI